jgi:hypothetical protein
VLVQKGFKGKYPITVCSMTKRGREALALYAEMLKESNGKFDRDGVTRGTIFGATLPAMFCPQCRVEYRRGFTRCSDCDVDLVDEDVAAGEYRRVRRSELPHELSAELWRGTDPHFYLALLASLGGKKVPCFGRPINPPMYGFCEEQRPGLGASTEFEVSVSTENLPFAQWILTSEEETYKEQEAGAEQSGDGDEAIDVEPGVTGICPLCCAQFAEKYSVCPNCGVPLRPPQRAALEQNPAKVLCNLSHPQFLADLRTALQRVEIPFNNAKFPQGPDTLRGDVVVLDSDFDRATQVLAQALQYWEFDRGISFGPSHDPREAYWPQHAKENGWYPEDLTMLLWTGTNLNMLDGVGMALREHKIAYSVESPEPGSAKLFVHPDDEEQARAILQDLLEGVSLE